MLHQVNRQVIGFSATAVWLDTLRLILKNGVEVVPRGRKTLELPHHSVMMDMQRPVVVAPERKLSYKFMAAEALWILSGSDRVDEIAPWNAKIAEFSDDGVTFAGAYGPRIAEQVEYVVDSLRRDRDTRQATLTTWRPNPARSKDVPCTVALDFKIRSHRLHAHVFMRSSDAWLGLPYDVFNFTMLAAYVACRYNYEPPACITPVSLGWLHLTAASSHLYEENWDRARWCLYDVAETTDPSSRPRPSAPIPDGWVTTGDWGKFTFALSAARSGEAVDADWQVRP